MWAAYASRDVSRDLPALICEDGASISVSQLTAAAGRVRTALAAVQPRGTPRVVAVAVPRSAEYVASVLGVLSAGAAWLAVDARQPASRLQAMLHDAAPEALLVADDDAAAALAAVCSAPLVRVDRLALWAAPDAASVAPVAAESEVAYLCSTSGSSGHAKLVLGTVKGLLSRCRWAAQEMPAAEGDVAALRTQPVFVDAAAELFAPLLAGVPLAIVPSAMDADPVALAALLSRRKVTRLTMLPSLLAASLPALAAAQLNLRLLLTSGELLPPTLAENVLRTFPGVRLLNVYGCTEVGADATAYDVSAEGAPAAAMPIGRPLPGVWCAVLGEDGLPVHEAGQVGELLVGGAGIALGYLNAPALTAARFPLISNGSADAPQRAHRTGDLAAWMPNGALVLHGRVDVQVKVRGQRVDLGEVEATLSTHPSVAAAVARPWPSLRFGDTKIAAYVTLRADAGESSANAVELRSWLAQRLLPAALPSAIEVLESLPTLASGKVDRTALPEPAWVSVTDDAPPSLDALEAQLRAAFAVELGMSESALGADADFFASGGTSLSAAALCARLALPLQALLDHPTPRALAGSGLVAGLAPQSVQQSSRSDDNSLPRTKRLRLPAHTDVAASPPTRADTWVPALALSFAGRCDVLDRGVTPAAIAAPANPHGASGDLVCAWRVPLHACVDASPLLLLPAAGSGTSWRAVVGSHAHNVLCVEFQINDSFPRVLWTTDVGCVHALEAFSPSVRFLTQMNCCKRARVESAAAALRDRHHVAVGAHDGGVSFLRLRDGSLSGRFVAAGAIKAALTCDPWTGRVWGASHGRDAFAVNAPPRTAVDGLPRCSALWQCSLDGAVSAPPSFDATRRRVYFATLAGTLIAVDDPADEVAPKEAWRARVGAAVFGAPAVAAGGLVIVSTVEGELRACAAADGSHVWRVAAGVGPLFAAPTLLADGALAVIGTHDCALLCVRCADGKQQWRLPLPGRVAAAAAVDAALSGWWRPAEQLIAVVTVAGEVHVLSVPPAGQPTCVASATLPGEAFSAPVLHNGLLLLGCRDDWLYCLQLRALLEC